MKKRKLNKGNLFIIVLVPIFFGIILVAIWALGLGISTLCHFPHGIFLNWLVGFMGVLALGGIYFFLHWLAGSMCIGIGMLIEFLYEEEKK